MRSLGGLNEIETSPIIGIHLFLRGEDNQPVMSPPHMVVVDGQVQWIFNKGMDRNSGVQHLHGVISAAHHLVDQSPDQLASMAVAELREVLPAARRAELVHSRVIKEKRATFSAQPGVDALRPAVEPGQKGVGNLYVAGDWVDTGWPATMESAVRSGYRAAAHILQRRGQCDTTRQPADLAPGLLYRLLSA